MSKSNALLAAMKLKFKTPEAVVRTLGLDEALLNEREDRMADYTRDRGFTRARRLGRDTEEELEPADPEDECDIIDHAILSARGDPEREMALNRHLREIAEDLHARRPVHRGASDRREHRRLGKDRAARRARDGEPGYPGGPEHFGGEPLRGGGMEPLDRPNAGQYDADAWRDGGDRRQAHDSRMAFDRGLCSGPGWSRYPSGGLRYGR
jgi:hypothetical protein